MGGTQVELEFSELHVNYDLTATQNGEVVFEETGLHSMDTHCNSSNRCSWF